MKSLDNRLESASIGFLGSAAVAQNFPKKCSQKKKNSHLSMTPSFLNQCDMKQIFVEI